MTARQKFLRWIYPVFNYIGKIFKFNSKAFSSDKPALQSFYELSARQSTGEEISFADIKGKKVLIVNTASDCGYTAQLKELEELYESKKDSLVILAFPANDFKEQEKNDDEAIAAFCKKNYGIKFPVMKKSRVVVHSDQNKVYEWLTDRDRNGWNEHAPTWNFCKYLVDEKGNLTHFFEAASSPASKKILNAIERKN